MIENQMVAGGAAPEPRPELSPEREEQCVQCGLYAAYVDGWYTETEVDSDGDTDWIVGTSDELETAADTRHGWFCSLRCRSQYMYIHAGDAEKRALDAVRDACLVIVEYGPTAFRVVNEETDGLATDAFLLRASEYLDCIGDESSPDWCNRPSAEDELYFKLQNLKRKIRLAAAELRPILDVTETRKP